MLAVVLKHECLLAAETILRCIKSGESVVNIASVYRNRLFREKYRNMRASRRAQETML